MLSAVVPRSFLQALAALSSAASFASDSVSVWSFAAADTHLPKALGFVPYRLAKLEALFLRMSLHFLAAFFVACCPGAVALFPGLSGLPLSAGGTARAAGTARARNAATTIRVRVTSGLRRSKFGRTPQETRAPVRTCAADC